MTTFDERDRKFENKFAHDEEMAFKINARRNKLLGLWAAEKLGKKGKDAEAYAQGLVAGYVGHKKENDLVEKLLADFKAGKLNLSASNIRAEMNRLSVTVQNELLGEKK